MKFGNAYQLIAYIISLNFLGSGVVASSLSVKINKNTLTKDKYLQYLANPAVRAFLDTIAFAEGTFNDRGYCTQYSYVYFDDFSDHPRQKQCKKFNNRLLCSDAAGRYQIKSEVWDKLVPRIGAKNFKPINQDRAAVRLLWEKGAIDLIRADLFEQAIIRVNKIWSSFPGSPYGQPIKKMKDLKNFYTLRLQGYQQKTKRNEI